MTTQTSQDLNAFIAALKDSDFFARAGRGFALLQPGDWQGLQRWAQALGYAFTLQELLVYCDDNPQILASMSGSSQLSGWTLDSLRQAAA